MRTFASISPRDVLRRIRDHHRNEVLDSRACHARATCSRRTVAWNNEGATAESSGRRLAPPITGSAVASDTPRPSSRGAQPPPCPVEARENRTARTPQTQGDRLRAQALERTKHDRRAKPLGQGVDLLEERLVINFGLAGRESFRVVARGRISVL